MPPRVIRVPPPKGAILSGWAFWSGVGMFGCAITWATAGTLHWSFLVFVALVWFCGLIVDYRRCYKRNRRIVWFRRRHEDWLEDPTAAQLDRLWYFPSIPPSEDKIEGVLWREKAGPLDRAVIVNMTSMEVPEPGDHRLEPEVVKLDGNRLSRVTLPFIVGLMIILGTVFLQAVGVVKTETSYFLSVTAIAAVVGGVFWQKFVRPHYLRVAPGVVQFLRYDSSKGRPKITEYPMRAGTLTVIRSHGAMIVLTTKRADFSDTAEISRSECDEDQWQRILRALVSTASAPPLSDDELVG